ncbi:Adenine phosphoribosyltransferase [Mycoplasmopsis meleagridis]|uniref:Adenine phosphoribosyltransferase n=1 Tax=Mycoplasmopsis meleagridis ATCC 25294 TaxID=1264554 RepID=A0A0F5H0Q9_9BACT|nr:adenine phosphoribosyltransferase [Mycoplasmopsis meleagridis]KKB26715.1 Adenine phosphoribosyltransferase [Mycoplasmopsis meleagridis ATCC 25294]OAD18169.1 Adenine phosphoribosyltransferase [Mycoplasmopsis meleagridis]VEU77248.1 adenine phosphoribosyltransferase [Mycoplasmopsis meleagridis]
MNLKEYVRDIHDFPKKGIVFKDISPLLNNGEKYHYVIKKIAELVKDCDVIVSPDARGFLFGAPTAVLLSKPFVMVRKAGKLPGETIKLNYQLQYGENILEIQTNQLKQNQQVAIIDDVLATGGTVSAIKKLVESQGAIVKKIVNFIELISLKGREKFEKENIEVSSILHYE